MITDLTEGKPGRVLCRFSIPMLISVIFQQLYNIADSVIAGKFAGEDALAAVGASCPITMIFMAIAVGSNIGCSVVVSGFFGARDLKSMKTAITTTFLACGAICVLLTAGGLIGCSWMMTAISTPDNIFSDAALYLRIYITSFCVKDCEYSEDVLEVLKSSALMQQIPDKEFISKLLLKNWVERK